MAMLNEQNSIDNSRGKFSFGFDGLGHLEPVHAIKHGNMEGHEITFKI